MKKPSPEDQAAIERFLKEKGATVVPPGEAYGVSRRGATTGEIIQRHINHATTRAGMNIARGSHGRRQGASRAQDAVTNYAHIKERNRKWDEGEDR